MQRIISLGNADKLKQNLALEVAQRSLFHLEVFPILNRKLLGMPDIFYKNVVQIHASNGLMSLEKQLCHLW